jgi:hypothetical protein
MSPTEKPPLPHHWPSVSIWYADNYIAKARGLWIGPTGFSGRGCWMTLRRLLAAAAQSYRNGGLGFLADRVDFFSRRVEAYRDLTNVRDLWEKFDRLNADATSVEKGGAA